MKFFKKSSFGSITNYDEAFNKIPSGLIIDVFEQWEMFDLFQNIPIL